MNVKTKKLHKRKKSDSQSIDATQLNKAVHNGNVDASQSVDNNQLVANANNKQNANSANKPSKSTQELTLKRTLEKKLLERAIADNDITAAQKHQLELDNIEKVIGKDPRSKGINDIVQFDFSKVGTKELNIWQTSLNKLKLKDKAKIEPPSLSSLEQDFDKNNPNTNYAGNTPVSLASEVDDGNLVMINESHGNPEGWVVTKRVIDASTKPGVLMLEAPYGLNFSTNFVRDIEIWSANEASNAAYGPIAQHAIDKGWKVVAVDSTKLDSGSYEDVSGNQPGVLSASGVPEHDNKRQTRLTLGGITRQNYIARNVNGIMKDEAFVGGGVLLIGGLHISGGKKYGVPPLSQMLTGSGPKNSSPVSYKKDGDIGSQIVDSNALQPDVTFRTEPNKLKPAFEKLTKSQQGKADNLLVKLAANANDSKVKSKLEKKLRASPYKLGALDIKGRTKELQVEGKIPWKFQFNDPGFKYSKNTTVTMLKQNVPLAEISSQQNVGWTDLASVEAALLLAPQNQELIALASKLQN